jgi:ATP-dependent Clp protease adaptor protein ClpS
MMESMDDADLPSFDPARVFGTSGKGGADSGLLAVPKALRPPLYRVLLMNDDYTPMDFVVDVLVRFFGKDPDSAAQTMLRVHERGVAVGGVYTFEVAETKVAQVLAFARRNEQPLQCLMEKAE